MFIEWSLSTVVKFVTWHNLESVKWKHLERGIKCLDKLACREMSWLFVDVGEPSPLWEAPFPGQVVLGYIKKANYE